MLKENVFLNQSYWHLDKDNTINKVCVQLLSDDHCLIKMFIYPDDPNPLVVKFARYENLFESAADAIAARKDKITKHRNSIESQINSVEDLVVMMLKTIIELDESCYKELEVAVMRDKARELLDIEEEIILD